MEKKFELHDNGYTTNLVVDDLNKFVKIGEQDHYVILKKDDWNNLVDLVKMGSVKKFD
ncbi:MAG: hypothetical protein ACFFAH_02105 [Promethearchaeota archaeon]